MGLGGGGGGLARAGCDARPHKMKMSTKPSCISSMRIDFGQYVAGKKLNSRQPQHDFLVN